MLREREHDDLAVRYVRTMIKSRAESISLQTRWHCRRSDLISLTSLLALCLAEMTPGRTLGGTGPLPQTVLEVQSQTFLLCVSTITMPLRD